MKKIIAAVICAVMMLSAVGVCSAQTIDSLSYGITFALPDTWIQTYHPYGFGFYHSDNANETILVEAMDYEPSYLVDIINPEVLREICHTAYSDAEIGNNMSYHNNTPITVIGDSALESYEFYNGIKYYRYEKAYTAYADGYSPTAFYLTAYITAVNGKLYSVAYERDYSTNNFVDVIGLLNSISFENGTVKININGERIYPDSAPMIISGRTLVPIRAVAERMGYTVNWDGANQLVTLTSYDGANVLFFGIGNNIAFKNNQEIMLDVPATIVDGRTYLPVRAVSEAMDAVVNWNGASRTVEIWK